jgi:hypothetical protein
LIALQPLSGRHLPLEDRDRGHGYVITFLTETSSSPFRSALLTWSPARFTSAKRKTSCTSSGAPKIWNMRGGNVTSRRNWSGLSSGELTDRSNGNHSNRVYGCTSLAGMRFASRLSAETLTGLSNSVLSLRDKIMWESGIVPAWVVD